MVPYYIYIIIYISHYIYIYHYISLDQTFSMSVLTADRYPIDTSVEVSGQSKSPSITFAPLFN